MKLASFYLLTFAHDVTAFSWVLRFWIASSYSHLSQPQLRMCIFFSSNEYAFMGIVGAQQTLIFAEDMDKLQKAESLYPLIGRGPISLPRVPSKLFACEYERFLLLFRLVFLGPENIASLGRREMSKGSGKREKRMEQFFSHRRRDNIEQQTEMGKQEHHQFWVEIGVQRQGNTAMDQSVEGGIALYASEDGASEKVGIGLCNHCPAFINNSK